MENLALATPIKETEESKVEYLPEEVIVAALEYANKVEGTSHILTSEQVRNRVYSRMGWK